MLKRHYRSPKNRRYNRLLGFLDGIEGGFAIFAGIVIGLSFSDVERQLLITIAIVGIIVNAVNAATIRYSTEHYYDELDGHEKHHPIQAYLVPSIAEFSIYIVVSALALAPLLLVGSLPVALVIMVLCCIGFLFMAGALRGHLLIERHWLRDGVEVALGGLIMIVVGSIAGYLVSRAF